MKKINILSVEQKEENKEVSIPTAKDISDNFKHYCDFLDDPCFDGYTPAELGEFFAKGMVLSNDITLFNFKLYGSFMTEYEKKRKSKKKALKNSLPEVFMHVLKHS